MTLVLFDVDGTLVDSSRIIVAGQRAAFATLGLAPPSRERSLSVVGLSLPQAFEALVGANGPVDDLAAAYRAAFAELRQDPAYAEPEFPGTRALLARLAAEPGVLLGIATGKSRRGIRHLVERHGWDRIFATVQTADDAPSKPHPAMILQAMAEVGANPRETAFVGDSTYDIAMGRAAGVHTFGVAWGFHREDALREAGAEAVAADARDLEALLSAALALAPAVAGR